MAIFGIFIIWPWLALIPSVIFLALYRMSGRGVVAAAAFMWCLYSIYEYTMFRRWLCSGECNIRVDLLLIYPVLILLSLVAMFAAVRGIIGRGRPAV